MSTSAEEAEFQRQLFDNEWQGTKQHWTDGGATHFELHHFKRIEVDCRKYSEALRRLTDLLLAAEHATEY